MDIGTTLWDSNFLLLNVVDVYENSEVVSISAFLLVDLIFLFIVWQKRLSKIALNTSDTRIASVV